MAFLDAINPQSILDRVRPILGDRARLTIIAGAAAAAIVATAASFWLWGSNYSVLYAGLSGEEGGHALAELQKLNIPYRITDGGRVIEVPASEVGRARLQLAARGVAKRDGNEWAILDNQSLGVSPFVEQVHYLRGIEATLSRTVSEVDGVVSAKVAVALPKQSDFLGDSPKPSASVMVRLRSGTTLSAAQVTGIVGIVASSVPGLATDHVTVVDQSGAVLNPSDKSFVLQAQQLDITHEINHRYEALITELLVPVLGRGNFRVSTDAEVDFSQTKESLVTYGDSHILSQEVTTHSPTDSAPAIGIPGALSNRQPETPTTNPTPPTPPQNATPKPPGATPAQPPTAADASPPGDVHKTTNYDIDKSVKFLEHPSWKLRGINVAVLVNNPTGRPIPPDRLQSINHLTASAIGAGQNPHVTVVDLPFEVAEAAAAEPVPWWREPWISAIGQNAMLALAGLLALFGGVLPLLRRLTSVQQTVLALRLASPSEGSAAAAGADGQASQTAARSSSAPQDVFSIEAETVQTLVTHDPARTAQVIRGWIAGDRGNLR